MIDGIEPLYQRIADGIVAALPDAWHRAWMDAIFYSDSIFFYCSYQSAEGGKCSSVATSMDVEQAFDDMRTLFKRAGETPWGRARIAITSEGKFDLQLSYDDCDEQGFARFDEDAEREWRRQVSTGAVVPLLGAKPA